MEPEPDCHQQYYDYYLSGTGENQAEVQKSTNLKISKRNTRSTGFLFHFTSYGGNYEPTCIVTIKMVKM